MNCALIQISARDGHMLDAYVAKPARAIRGGIVIGQEMYGLTNYLRETCEFFAAHGYAAIAPALYDRRERGLVLEYNKANHDLAQSIYKKWDWNHALDDLDAGQQAIADAGQIDGNYTD